jgi:antitoxin CptB
MTEIPASLKRLYYQSWHRGTREMDLILGQFADQFLATMTPAEQMEYADLLKESDSDLWGWIGGNLPIPLDKKIDLLEKIKAFYSVSFRQISRSSDS